MVRKTKRIEVEEDIKKRRNACERVGCNEGMFCYGGGACYSLCDNAEIIMKEESEVEEEK